MGDRIKQLRFDKGVTQAELAKAAGVSVQAVSKWECGGTPDVGLLPAIASFFNVTIDELFGRSITDGIPLEDLVFREIRNAPEDVRLKRTGDICWVLFKAISKIPNTRDTDFASGAEDQTSCTRGYANFDTGFAYVCALGGAQSYFFFPEPENGFSSVLSSRDDYLRLFSLLCEPEAMDALLFLYRRRAVPFSIEHICKELHASAERMTECLNRFKEFGWIEEELVELDSGAKALYRPKLTEAVIGFLYFASEIIYKIKLWYMSNDTRTKPLL
ncbi:MAG: helix-turn-helix transcriptional regulator [Eubacteriales bacterium]|nr:helix-turn-helix transcriptional regulator [Eubacteriales bacterium]